MHGPIAVAKVADNRMARAVQVDPELVTPALYLPTVPGGFVGAMALQALGAPMIGTLGGLAVLGLGTGLLARDMPELEGYLHYRNVDVSSVKELARRWFPKAPHTHVALDDAREQGLLFINMLKEHLARPG